MRPNDPAGVDEAGGYARAIRAEPIGYRIDIDAVEIMEQEQRARQRGQPPDRGDPATIIQPAHDITCARSEEHTSELQSLMRISSAVFCLTKKKPTKKQT